VNHDELQNYKKPREELYFFPTWHNEQLDNVCLSPNLRINDEQRRYDMNGRSQMQGVKNWILPKEIKCKPVLLKLSLAGNLKKKTIISLCMGPNGGSVAMDSVRLDVFIRRGGLRVESPFYEGKPTTELKRFKHFFVF
jgi:hypothetical protein